MRNPVGPMLVLVTVMLSGLGCASKEPVETFTPSRVTRGVGVRQEGPLAGYHRFTIDDIRLVTAPDVAMDPQAERQVIEQLRRELVVRLADDYEVVAPPGAGVLRLGIRVLGVRPGPAFGLADATMESLVTDSVTGQRLLTIRDRRSQRGYVDRSLVSDWENARNVMQSWADVVDKEIEGASR